MQNSVSQYSIPDFYSVQLGLMKHIQRPSDFEVSMNLSTIFFNSEAMGSKSPVLFCWAKRNSRQHYKTIILGERGEVDKRH